jgi:ribulose bisphosphate carboxylase small subunit
MKRGSGGWIFLKSALSAGCLGSTPVAPGSQATVEDRLQQIKALLDKGSITQVEYNQKRVAILSGI